MSSVRVEVIIEATLEDTVPSDSLEKSSVGSTVRVGLMVSSVETLRVGNTDVFSELNNNESEGGTVPLLEVSLMMSG